MRLLLTSFGHDRIRDFVRGTVAYIPDATRLFASHPDAAPFIDVERDMLREHGLQIRELRLETSTPAMANRVLSEVDGVYVAGGETFDLLWLLRTTGIDEVLVKHVRAGLPYIGTSAGSVVAGPSIAPVSLLDSPEVAPDLGDYTGLQLCEHVIIPHAGGTIPQFPIEIFADTVRKYGADYPLVLLKDGQALLVDDLGTHLI
ncbi:putative peptidase [Corynebacterium deserti GIMN1.010]|uniref:Putative peptidase n=1 Tax=Corynebacterium deserti GIMN1.010 TaxID=931089 RepID=A0A0M4CW47_9CORY|nr:Type 1 glutamine amidotransferase-like domain-containing protein [Corynebacterium deserti]ALC04957.1 putative peptidase [Corynebacterium deserti GIMN1.010]